MFTGLGPELVLADEHTICVGLYALESNFKIVWHALFDTAVSRLRLVTILRLWSARMGFTAALLIARLLVHAHERRWAQVDSEVLSHSFDRLNTQLRDLVAAGRSRQS